MTGGVKTTLSIPFLLFSARRQYIFRWLSTQYTSCHIIVVESVALTQIAQDAQLAIGRCPRMSNVDVIREKFVTTFQSSLMFWIPAQAVNFLLVPAQLRVVYVASLSLLWANIFCLIKREPTQQQTVSKSTC